MKIRYVLSALVALVLVAAGVALIYFRTMPIVIAATEGDDLCGAYGVAKGSAEKPIALKVRPSGFSATVTYLEPGAGLIMCSESDGWSGVIVRDGSALCVDRTNRAESRQYGGPCASGWLPTDRIELVAG